MFTLGLSSGSVTDKSTRSGMSSSYSGGQRFINQWRRTSLDVSVGVLSVHTEAPVSARVTPIQSPLPSSNATSLSSTPWSSGMGTAPTSAAAPNGHRLAQSSNDSQLWESARTLHDRVNGIWQFVLNRVHSYAPNYSALMVQAHLAGREADSAPTLDSMKPAVATLYTTDVDRLSDDPASLLPPSALNLPTVKMGSEHSTFGQGQDQAQAASQGSAPREVVYQKVVASVIQPAAAATPLHRFLTAADQTEVTHASMLADLCDLAYDVQHVSSETLHQRHMLLLIATSIGDQLCSSSLSQVHAYSGESIVLPDVSAEEAKAFHMHVDTAAQQAEEMLLSIYEATLDTLDAITDDEAADPSAHIYTGITSAALTLDTMDSYEEGDRHDTRLPARARPMGHHGNHSSSQLAPGVSMLELSTPEAVTAALTSAGNAFSHPMYVSELQHALNIIGTYDEDDEVASTAAAAVRQGRRSSSGASGASSPRSMLGGSSPHAGSSPLGSPRVSRNDTSSSSTAASTTTSVAASLHELRTYHASHALSDISASMDESSMAMHGAALAGSSGDDAYNVGMHGVPTGPHGASMQGGTSGAHLSSPPVVLTCPSEAGQGKPPPAAWFCADDASRQTRYFSIQGSNSMDHWRINLQFEPVTFEHPSLGVRVHRGVYEAAQELYEVMLPLVKAHIATGPQATVAFTGHSLGGSLGTVLMLLYVHRGVLRPDQVSPVYTFGAPAVFCQGVLPEQELAGERTSSRKSSSAVISSMLPGMDGFNGLGGKHGLLSCLGLSGDHVVNVIMHRDIVPRAFVCDYGSVAGVLQRWWPSFKGHASLQPGAGPHRSLYSFMGRVAILRPREAEDFVMGDADHPMLPAHAALYRVALPEDLLLLPPSDLLQPLYVQLAAAAAALAERFTRSLDEGLSGSAVSIPTSLAAASAAAEALFASTLALINNPCSINTGPNGAFDGGLHARCDERACVAVGAGSLPADSSWEEDGMAAVAGCGIGGTGASNSAYSAAASGQQDELGGGGGGHEQGGLPCWAMQTTPSSSNTALRRSAAPQAATAATAAGASKAAGGVWSSSRMHQHMGLNLGLGMELFGWDASSPVSLAWSSASAPARDALRSSLAAFMNQPHPLTTLSDYGAYGDKGAISRFHNPNHYARALLGLIHNF